MSVDAIRMLELSPNLSSALGFHPELTFPVRSDRVGRIFKEEELDVAALVEEVHEVVLARPELNVRYGAELGKLAYLVGCDLGRQGYYDVAARFFTLGLLHDPDNLSLRLHLALAYHRAGRLEEAVQQYVAVLDDQDVGVSPMVFMLAGRACLDMGDPAGAEAILSQAEHVMYEDDTYWDLRAEAQRRSGLAPRKTHGASQMARDAVLEILAEGAPPGLVVCPTCLTLLQAGGSICPECGQDIGGGLGPGNVQSRLAPIVIPRTSSPPAPAPAEPPIPVHELPKPPRAARPSTPPPVSPATPPSVAPRSAAGACGGCGAILKPGAKFCAKCGRPVAPPPPAPSAQAACTTCGTPVKPGARFCGKCGSPLVG